ncbi:MAG: hypothetical protein WCP18_04410 [bacterium]
MNNDKLYTTIKTSQKVATGLAVVLLFCSVAFFVWQKYYLSAVQLNQEQTISINNKPVDMEQLTKDYKQNFQAELNVFINSAGTVSGTDLVNLANSTKAKLLDLTVPPGFQENHLTAVIDLNKISQKASQGQDSSAEIEELKKILSNF